MCFAEVLYKFVHRHAENLLQLDNGKKIPPCGWKCEKCDLTQNLWLNLTDGSVLCGRKFYDGSGGNDHAVEHYRLTGNRWCLVCVCVYVQVHCKLLLVVFYTVQVYVNTGF